jgi:hypothetical protein
MKQLSGKEAADIIHPEFGGSPLLQQGELDFSPAEKRFIAKGRALALDFRGACQSS